MPRGRDEAGNIWELDANGHAVRMVQPAAPASFGGGIPGVMGVVPPNPAMVAKDARDQARQDAMDKRSQISTDLAIQAAARAQKKFESEDTMAPPPGDITKTGEDYLATIPPALAGQVRAMIDGRRAFPTGSALRSPAVQQLIAAATQADPTLDATNSFTRVATRKKFTSGTTRDNITAINTALGHLGTLWQDAQKLNNFGSPMLNAPVNAFETHALGDPRYTNFNLTRHAVVDELEKAFRGSGGTQTGIEEWKQGINNSQSPEQLRGAVGKAVELLDSRLQALGDAYAAGMGRSSDPMVFLNPHAKAVFSALGPGGDGNVPNLPKDFGGTPPVLGGSDAPPPSPPPPPGPPTIRPSLPGGIPSANYSSMTGGPGQALAMTDPNSKLGAFKQTYRQAFDPVGAAALSAFIKRGAPYETAAAYAQSHGFNPPPQADYQRAVAFQKTYPNATPNVEADKNIPTTLGERLASSPLSAALAGGAAGATAGISDAVGRTLAGPGWDANRAALSAAQPGADVAGNVIGGGAGMLGGEALLGKIAPGALALAGKASPVVSDLAYGGLYGANENPADPLIGAAKGALAGAGGGLAGRAATRGLAGVIAPSAGPFAPLYEQRGFPTLGQKLGATGGLAGKIANVGEQALQSFPGLGMMVAGARQGVRDVGQVGAFNRSLRELQPFKDFGLPTSLPKDVGPGMQAHSIASGAFNKAYDVARSGMRMVPDPQFETEQAAFNSALGNSGLLSDAQAGQVNKVINDAVHSRLNMSGGELGGDAYKSASSQLDRTIRSWSGDPAKSDMANALSDFTTIFDNAARRASNPNAVNLLDAADRGYAQLVRIQRASELGGAAKDAGTFTPTNYAGAVKQMGGGVRSNAYNRGTALGQDYANALLPLRDTLPNSGTSERLLTSQALAGLGGGEIGAGGFLMAHPGSLAPFAAYLPGVRNVVNRAIAPNAQRLALLPPDVAAVLNRVGNKVNDIAPLIGKAAMPGSLAYYGIGQ